MSNVRFIRVRGRVVAIRPKTGAKPRVQRAKPQGRTDVKKIAKAVAFGLVAGAAVYFLARRFKASKNLKLAELQRAVEKHGIGMVTEKPKVGSVIDKAFEKLHGLRTDRAELRGGVVLNRIPGSAQFYKPAHTINPKRITDILDSKRDITKIVDRTAMPQTMHLEKALEKVGWQPKKLKSIFPKFIIKDAHGAMNNVSDFVNETNVARKASFEQLTRAHSSILQERLPLTGEYRAHFLNGEVFGISHRRLPHPRLENAWNAVTSKIGMGKGGGAFVPVLNPFERYRIKKLVRNSVDLSRLKKTESAFAAFDIGKTKDSLKILEANPTPGTFANPLVNRRFKELATGRMSKAKAGAAAFAVGSGVTSYALPEQRRKRK